jgi:hypothetical protein
MMRAWLTALFFAAASLAGCGRPGPNLPPPPPHGGTAFPLPDGKGFVEALRQDAPDHAGRTRLVIYFLDVERKPLRPAPTAASFLPRGRRAANVALGPIPDAGPSEAGGLASPPFDEPGDIVGLLSATIESRPVSIAISIR